MNEATAFESLMKNKDVQFEVDDRIEAAWRQGFEAGQAQYEEKHWNECRQISEYQAENKALKELLKQAVEGFKYLGNALDRNCEVTPGCGNCPLNRPDGDCRVWNKQTEAMKLIGGGEEL